MDLERFYEIYREGNGVTIDSRNVPQNSMFIAIKGDNFDGNTFAESALESGASYVVIDDEAYWKDDDRYILVNSGYEALRTLAMLHRKHLKIPFIGITGTNGKTTTKELIHAVLSSKHITYTTQGNLNNHIGVPLTILGIKDDAEIAVIEMGASRVGEIAFLCEIARPDYGIITNVGMAHLEGFGSFENVVKTKCELYDFLRRKGDGHVFVNSEDSLLLSKIIDIPMITYGESEANFCIGSQRPDNSLFASLNWSCNGQSGVIKTNLVGGYNFYNILAAVCVGSYFNVEPELFIRAIENYQPSNNRSQIIPIGTNSIISDCYNANPSSVDAALINFFKAKIENKWVIMGQMLELGEDSQREHQKIYSRLKFSSLDKIILVGDAYSKLDSDERVMIFPDADKAGMWIEANVPKNTTILIKGSRGNRLEKVIDKFR